MVGTFTDASIGIQNIYLPCEILFHYTCMFSPRSLLFDRAEQVRTKYSRSKGLGFNSYHLSWVEVWSLPAAIDT